MKYERLTIRNSDGSVSQPTNSTIEKVFNRLAELEDDLESGKIIRLPCKVDSEIYAVDYLTDDEDKDHYYIRKFTFHPKWIDEWRNMFYLTREEAEAKLKELQE